MKLDKMTILVKNVLMNQPETRSSDNVLYLAVIDEITENSSRKSIKNVLLNGAELGLPPFETVSRVRRKIQAANPELRGSEESQRRRRQLETEFHDYYAKG